MAPTVLEHPGARPTERIGTLAVDIRESSAPHAHPSTEEHDDEHGRPHACNGGWVTISQIVVDPETEECALYLCRKCAERS